MIRIKGAHFTNGKLDEKSMKKIKEGFGKKIKKIEKVKEVKIKKEKKVKKEEVTE